MKKYIFLLSFLFLSFHIFSQKLSIIHKPKSAKPSLAQKGLFNVMLLNDTKEPIRIFYSHHKEYGGNETTSSTLKDGVLLGESNRYKPMDTNSRFDQRAFDVIKPGQKKMMATLALEPKEAGKYTLTYHINQDPAKVNMAFAKNGTAKGLAGQITKMDITASFDYVVEAMEVKAFEAREVTYEELKKMKASKDFKEAAFDPSAVFAMNLELKNAKDAAEKFEQLTKLKNLKRLTLNVRSSEEVVVPENVGSLPLMMLTINGKGENLKFPANFLKGNSLKEANLNNVDGSSLDFLGGHTGIVRIYISNNNWTSIPAWIGNLTALESLGISRTQITSIPVEFEKLTKLQSLGLDRNQLKSVPHLYNNAGLTTLSLQENQLTTLPEEIGQLKSLKKIQLYKNKLSILPAGIGGMSSLENLHLGNNELTELPTELGNLAALKDINLENNQFKKFPMALTQLENLGRLVIKNNNLTSFPKGISKMKKVSFFNFENNQIETLGAEFFTMKKLFRIFTAGNSIGKKERKKLDKTFGRRVKS